MRIRATLVQLGATPRAIGLTPMLTQAGYGVCCVAAALLGLALAVGLHGAIRR